MTKICSVIPTFNRKEYLKILLSKLHNQNYYNFSLEIVVVVDGSTDGTFEMLKKYFPQVHILKGTGNWWYTKSMNEGFKYAEKFNPDYILTLNDDIEIDNNYVQTLVDDIKRVKGSSIMGTLSLTNTKPHKIVEAGIKKIIKWRFKLVLYYYFLEPLGDKKLKGIYPSATLSGRGMLIPYCILKKLNYFDETFKQYSSDFDFCLRAKKIGYNSYISWDAKIFSHVDKSSKSSSFIRTTFFDFVKEFYNPYSRIFLISKAIYIWRHGIKIIWPISFFIFILSSFKAHFFNPKLG